LISILRNECAAWILLNASLHRFDNLRLIGQDQVQENLSIQIGAAKRWFISSITVRISAEDVDLCPQCSGIVEAIFNSIILKASN
jgi:hypothetical protein